MHQMCYNRENRNREGKAQMDNEHTMKVIARIHSDFRTKFGIPRQSGLVKELRAEVIF